MSTTLHLFAKDWKHYDPLTGLKSCANLPTEDTRGEFTMLKTLERLGFTFDRGQLPRLAICTVAAILLGAVYGIDYSIAFMAGAGVWSFKVIPEPPRF